MVIISSWRTIVKGSPRYDPKNHVIALSIGVQASPGAGKSVGIRGAGLPDETCFDDVNDDQDDSMHC